MNMKKVVSDALVQGAICSVAFLRTAQIVVALDDHRMLAWQEKPQIINRSSPGGPATREKSRPFALAGAR